MNHDNDEFINRERQQGPDVRQRAPDVGTLKNMRAMERAPAGEPPIDYTVRSVFDSRPINAGDFNVLLLADGGETALSQVVDLTFTVPEGRVAILREVEVWISSSIGDENPTTVYYNRESVTISPILNGGEISNNTYAVGNGTTKPATFFVIADTQQLLGIRVRFADAPTENFNLYAQLYGNLILKTGRAVAFEVGNFAGGVSTEGKRA